MYFDDDDDNNNSYINNNNIFFYNYFDLFIYTIDFIMKINFKCFK
jgi:hypothetical protein